VSLTKDPGPRTNPRRQGSASTSSPPASGQHRAGDRAPGPFCTPFATAPS
jgi:hypothetical protein